MGSCVQIEFVCRKSWLSNKNLSLTYRTHFMDIVRWDEEGRGQKEKETACRQRGEMNERKREIK